MKIFAQESLGRPDLEVKSDIEDLISYMGDDTLGDIRPVVKAALVFTNPDIQINISEEENTPAETVYVAKLKDLIRKYAKNKTLSLDKLNLITEKIET